MQAREDQEISMLTYFDASTVREGERFAYWHEEICRNFCRAESTPVAAERFDASLSRTELGTVQISQIECAPLRYQRAPSDVRSAPSDDFLLSLLLDGEGHLEQHGHHARQQVGDVAIYDTAQPFVYQFPDRYRMALLKVPRRAMLARVPTAEQLPSLLISGQTALGALAGNMIRNAAALDLDGPAAAKVGASIVDVIAAAMDVEFGGMAPVNGRHASLLARAQSHIRSHLDDPELDVESIAAALSVSTSTLARLFAGAGTTVMRWLWDERLATSHRVLVEGRARQVTEVALSCGFSSFSHFSRSFKARYGQSPNTLMKSGRSAAH